MAFNRKQKLRDNIEAIRTAFILSLIHIYLRARVVREQVVGQAYRGYQIGLTEQLVTHGGLGAIQYPLRGDERHDTAVKMCIRDRS